LEQFYGSQAFAEDAYDHIARREAAGSANEDRPLIKLRTQIIEEETIIKTLNQGAEAIIA
jgi:hypothetical protein